MRNINNRDLRVATRTILREINREMMLNLIRERQPIFRAAQTNLSAGNGTAVRLQVFRCFQFKIFIGGY